MPSPLGCCQNAAARQFRLQRGKEGLPERRLHRQFIQQAESQLAHAVAIAIASGSGAGRVAAGVRQCARLIDVAIEQGRVRSSSGASVRSICTLACPSNFRTCSQPGS
jgi:hypothetical protein